MTPFITVQHLKDNAVVQENFQADLLSPYIEIAQDMYILRVLSTPLYDSITNDIISAGSISAVTGNNATLLTIIKPALIYATAFIATPFLHTRITNKGIVYKESPNQSSTASDKWVMEIQAKFKSFMEFYIEELKRFLRKNQVNYPLWREEYFSNYEQYSGATYTRGSTGYQGPLLFDRSGNYNQDLLGG